MSGRNGSIWAQSSAFGRARSSSRNTSRWEAVLIPTPIRQVLSTIRTNGVQALLMGGQACVFYGAAQVSKDIDLVLRAEDGPIRIRDCRQRVTHTPLANTLPLK